jgi:hypothetical protein
MEPNCKVLVLSAFIRSYLRSTKKDFELNADARRSRRSGQTLKNSVWRTQIKAYERR